jgi:hypothetical protein
LDLGVFRLKISARQRQDLPIFTGLHLGISPDSSYALGV